jgi:Lon-like ATP-dependent protease
MLFIDEIGELHPVQMNKLLKVLEDRKVFLESAYYNSEDPNVPAYIHDIFENGLPADFRLVGATTRTPQEIPPAIRSRCMEIFFRPLLPEEIAQIATGALRKIGFADCPDAVDVVKKYATNGREAVNVIQLAVGIAMTDARDNITAADIEWVVNSSQIQPRPEKKIPAKPYIGLVNGLAVYGPNLGTLLEIEVTAIPAKLPGGGTFNVTGVVDEEEMGGGNRTIRRKSMARGSVDNVLTVLRHLELNPQDFDLHINFPGGVPIDGPSAGISMATAISSAIRGIPVDNKLAMTGEVSIHGKVKPIGGVVAKVEAARQAGVTKVIVPKDNWQEMFGAIQGMEIIPVETIEEVLEHALGLQFGLKPGFVPAPQEMMIAEQIGVLHTHLIK